MTADWTHQARSADEAVACVTSGMRIFIHGAAATPTPLVDALARRDDLHDITLYHLHTEGPMASVAPALRDRFRSVSLFTGPAFRTPVNEGRADYVPIFLHQIPRLFNERIVDLDVAMVMVSPPDEHGFMSLGVETLAVHTPEELVLGIDPFFSSRFREANRLG